MNKIAQPNKETTVFLFGSQVENLSKDSLNEIRSTLQDRRSRQWILDTVAELPDYWDALAKEIPEITEAIGTRGKRLLANLDAWLRHGPDSEQEDDLMRELEGLPSVVLSPLVVLTQLTQYRQYLELQRRASNGAAGTDVHAQLVGQKKTSTLGFCMGLLGAFAIASARNGEEVDQYGAVAVRVAMVGGALIDAQDEWSKQQGLGPSKSYATAWRNASQREEMERVVSSLFPEAYISVLYDEARATVTTSERAAPRLLRQMRAAGLMTAEVGFRGDIHSPKQETKAKAEALLSFCSATPGLKLPDASHLALPTYTNAGDGKPVDPGAGAMQEIALRTVFMQQCNWYGTFASVKAARLDHDSEGLVVTFGPDQCAPPTLMRLLGPRLLHFGDLPFEVRVPPTADETEGEIQKLQEQSDDDVDINESAIAVVGMSIKVAGADDLDEFSRMLQTGESQHELITPDRIAFDTLFREGDKDRKWYANFVRDPDAFDHKFFKRSPRESASTDPQQRMLLQAAYQAVEQSGYFTEATRSTRKEGKSKQHVGVFIGSPAVDYEHNVACHNPNAFTATGNLQSFLAGRVAHWFGWTGPAITLDTACSSSAVGIHMACRNLLTGECNAALAGGVALCTNPLWFQNLAAASFLSPTGQCKPFDSQADGFCRAEGVACVFLKRMSDAIADGNPILGCIASSAVYQNQNCTPMFVPNSPSLSELFKNVIQQSKVAPGDISLVEAHGTGTPIGDPAEYESIKVAMGGPGVRSKPLPIGSVKGHVGHAEGASGAVSLIKVLMMMHENYIPPQASFSRINPAIKASPSDMLEVVTSRRPWSDSNSKKALINNYGACGSNAAMVVTQSRYHNIGLANAPIRGMNAADAQHKPRFPFWISGLDARSIHRYAAKLVSYLKAQFESQAAVTLADISFNVDRLCNPALGQSLVFSCSSVTELHDTLSQVVADATSPPSIEPSKPERPVILCFGGQVSTFVGLDRNLYETVTILRHHLDECDAVMQSAPLGLGSIYPGIFSSTPEEDPVRVQTMLFAMQYACARSWIDCGLSGKITAVVGHSFGELTALCISGALSLQDAIRLVAARARLISAAWGPDKGAMMAVEADASLVQELVAKAHEQNPDVAPAEIACYNGVRSFTLAGPTKAIEAVAETIAKQSQFSAVKSKRLNVTNAFHSSLVDPLVDRLEEIGKDLTFKKPSIPLELATETRSARGHLTPRYVADHMRKPVFFCHAIQRLAEENPSAIFLEAGSSSGITVMASRALSTTSGGSSHSFQAIKVTNCNGLDGLTDATVSLWKLGLRVSFWAHHALQTDEYAALLLPPYQFEKSRHWLDLKSPVDAVAEAAARLSPGDKQKQGQDGQDEKSLGLWTFIGYRDEQGQKAKGSKRVSRRPRFRINTGSEEYKKFVSGHIIAQTAPICPGTLQVDMAIEALFSLHPEWKDDGLQPIVHDMVNHSPLCVDPSRIVWLDFASAEGDQTQWSWSISSTSDSDEQTYVQGRIRVRSAADASYAGEFARFERLVTHKQAAALLAAAAGDDEDVEVLQGRNVYRTFSEFVDYADMYRGVRAVVGRGDECAGRVVGHYSGKTMLDTLLDDSFSQVAGLWVNCMTDLAPGDMYIATGIDLSMRSPRGIIGTHLSQDVWHVYVRNTRQSDTAYLSDVFVFDAATQELAEVMLGIQYSRVSKTSMSRMLTKLTKDKSVLRSGTGTGAVTPNQNSTAENAAAVVTPALSSQQRDVPNLKEKQKKKKKTKKTKASSGRPDITGEIKKLVATVAGMDASEITLDTEVADIGIDSLMGMELTREVQVVFKCAVDQETLLQATSVRQLVDLISGVLSAADGGDATAAADSYNDENDSDESSSDHDDWSTSSPGNSAPATSLSRSGTGTTTPDSTKAASTGRNLELSPTDILECFGQVKMNTDQRLRDLHVDNVDRVIIAGTSQLCVSLIVEAFEQLGCSLRAVSKGDTIERVPFLPEYDRLVEWLYSFLENDARLLDIDATSGKVTRTAVAVPSKPSEAIVEDLLEQFPDWAVTTKLIYHAGKPLAKILCGETDGIRILFGSAEGRELMAGHYRYNPFAALLGGQMGDFLARLANKIRTGTAGGTLKVLEMGAGTGGTTLILAPLLASLDIPVEYTFTDLSSSMVAAARRTLGKQYPFLRFAVHDIEKTPADELCGQHIIIASNAVHATHNLIQSARNVRKALRPDGLLMMLEQTEDIPLSNLIFGLFEGWWLFDDGRTHAVVPTENWERDLHAAGFGHVDWTDGHLPENNIQRVIVALASGSAVERLPIPAPRPALPSQSTGDVTARESEAEKYVAEHTAGWATPALLEASIKQNGKETENLHNAVVVVTGATGSLGSHLVAAFAEHPDVQTVVCVNRRSSSTPIETRQAEAFSKRGILLSPGASSKLRILETDTSRPHLGLAASEYDWLVQHGTHIVHNAWPMSGTRPLPAFIPQFQTMRNLLDLAHDMACRTSGSAHRIGFQLVTSIGVVGHAGLGRVPEERVSISAVLPTGYCEGKWVCERMLDETLHKYSDLFRPMVVRPGQISGSTTSGVWNPVEHFAFMVKSAQSLRAWPDLDGILQWVPVNAAAATMTELLQIGNEVEAPEPYPVYHIDNPVGQPWKEMSPVLAGALGIPRNGIIPYRNWLRRITRSPLSEMENPAVRIIDFLDSNYERMSCGGLILDTSKSQEHSKTMATLGPVTPEVAVGYVSAWKKMGFLSS